MSQQVRASRNTSRNTSSNLDNINGKSSNTSLVEEAILRGKRTELQGNSAESLVRFELQKSNYRIVVIAEDIKWRRRQDEDGKTIGRYRIVTQYIMDTTNEPKEWVDLNKE